MEAYLRDPAVFGPEGSVWRDAGRAHDVDPLLLYSIALIESKQLQGNGSVSPTPYVARINDQVVSGSKADVERALELAQGFNLKIQDVGMMQVFYPQHLDLEADPVRLVDPLRNVDVAATILHECLQSSKDPIVAIGHYHSYDDVRARYYGRAVWTVYRRLTAFVRSGDQGAAPPGTLVAFNGQATEQGVE